MARPAIPFVSRLSSGTKMLFIMTVALMPLGVIALFASVQSARAKQMQHVAEARIVAAAEARQIDLLVLRASTIVRLAAATAAAHPDRCRALMTEAQRAIGEGAEVSLFGRREGALCATDPTIVPAPVPPRGAIGAVIELSPNDLRFTARAPGGAIGVGMLPRALLADVIGVSDRRQGVALVRGNVRLPLVTPVRARRFDRRITASAPLGGGQVNLVGTSVASSISAIEVALVLLPLLMWAAAAIIGWIVINELLLRPLADLQRAVAGLGTEAGFTLPRLSTPAREIRGLGEAFADASAEIHRREQALADAFQNQVKLTREVHHRVKNNLQVVASLINLHARGSSGEVASAYASIQRRVDALAIVHRNHFAELEVNRGVALRALVAELTSNLRATAPAAAGQLRITLDMAPAHVSQDVAVPVAFLLTEIVELVMECGPNAAIDISLMPQEGDRAMLTVAAPSLREPGCLEHPLRERFDRIVAGLARQLRAPLTVDEQTGAHSIRLAVLPETAA